MSIRLKLLFSYLIMLVVPLLTLIVTSILLVIIFKGDLHDIRMIYETNIEGFEEEDYHRLIKQSIEQNPDLLLDRNYVNRLSSQLSSKQTYLLIRTDEQMIYVSDELRTKAILLSKLTSIHNNDLRSVSRTKSYGNNDYYHYVGYAFHIQNKAIDLYIITKVDPIVYFSKKYAPYLLGAVIVVLVLTNVLLTLYMSRRIIRPIMSLRRSALSFTEGNLNDPVIVHGKDEIGQLGVVFEKLRTQLLHSFRVQEQFENNRKELIINISHDLKTPITSIRGYVDGLIEGVALSLEKTEKYLRTISNKAAEMDRLIDELFLYSKLDLNRMTFVFETVNVKAFLADWIEELAFELEKEGISLLFNIQIIDSIEMKVDRKSFRRVLENIIQNSLKYMNKEEKIIQLVASISQSNLNLTIEDNGSGIPDSALPYIFDRFYRADLSRNSEITGNGLGLAIAKRIVLEHNGSISAESTEGVGTKMTISIPKSS
ncbi:MULTISPECIES: sensor histidine kinase [unclassified Paenibacillus]|uniref:sensor histidine kinase n=1 Tax=unclassified Paenibacillus TaxID=185978 RepID=UPI001053E261|nr:HAMP domain-containing sensor histidine kinase [Paenibacillus sp. BK033]TCM99411.1 histidine kinase [Paenibacillus sp. BK033]